MQCARLESILSPVISEFYDVRRLHSYLFDRKMLIHVPLLGVTASDKSLQAAVAELKLGGFEHVQFNQYRTHQSLALMWRRG